MNKTTGLPETADWILARDSWERNRRARDSVGDPKPGVGAEARSKGVNLTSPCQRSRALDTATKRTDVRNAERNILRANIRAAGSVGRASQRRGLRAMGAIILTELL